jgi:hypothetical protein
MLAHRTTGVATVAKIVPFTKNREVIYGLLKRARRYHCTCTSQHEYDVTELMKVLDAYREAGTPVSINACLIHATGLLLKKFPRLNHHLFTGVLRKYEVDFERICCNAIMLREDDGEAILLPLLIEDPETLTVQEIDEILEYNKKTPLQQLPQIQGMQKLKRMPRLALKAFSYMARSNHRFYRKFFGTYGYSSLIMEGARGVRMGNNGIAAQSAANTCTGFIPCYVTETPVVIDGEIQVRKMLGMTILMDHYLIDGHDSLLASRYIARLLEHPEHLGLQAPEKPKSSQSLA